MAGHYAKAGVEAGRGAWEFRLADGEGDDLVGGKLPSKGRTAAHRMIKYPNLYITRVPAVDGERPTSTTRAFQDI